MPTSIFNASIFHLGAIGFIADAQHFSSDPELKNLSVENIAEAAFEDSSPGNKIRLSIEKITKRNDNFFRRSPQYVLTTQPILDTRSKVIKAFNNLNLAVSLTLFLNDQPHENHEKLKAAYVAVYEGLDQFPGRTSLRREMIESFHSQVFAMSKDNEVTKALLFAAQQEYLNKMYQEETLGMDTDEHPDLN